MDIVESRFKNFKSTILTLSKNSGIKGNIYLAKMEKMEVYEFLATGQEIIQRQGIKSSAELSRAILNLIGLADEFDRTSPADQANTLRYSEYFYQVILAMMSE